MRDTRIGLILTILIVSSAASAQDRSTEFQWRVLTHVQLVPTQGVGVAGWMILPDVLQNNPSRLLMLFGIVEAWNGRWIELMGGVLRNGRSNEPVVNVRFSKSDLAFLDLFLEFQHNISTRTFYMNPIATVPFEAAGVIWKAGLELDWFLYPQTESLLIGPRLSVSVSPFLEIVKSIQWTAAYKFGTSSANIFRMYILFTV